MTTRQPNFINQATTSPNTEPPALLGWLAISFVILFTVACIAVGAGSILRPGYVVITFLVGIFLYFRYPMLYMGFSWWLWFVTPFVSRVIDWRTSFDPTRVILVSQYLVTLITLITCLKELPKSYRQGGLPFILAFAAVFYGFLVGLIKTIPLTVVRGLFDWLTPVSFGFFLFVKWRDYPQYRQNIQRVFLWGVLLAGAYGIYQYLVAPDWDRYWLISTKLHSMGEPAPFKMRVWSTMASSGPFAVMMTAGLLLLLNYKHFLKIPAYGVGVLAFLLSMVRTMWGGWLLGLVTLISSLKPYLQMRLFLTIILMIICIFPLTTIEPFSKVISERIDTFSNLQHDDSAKVREKIYEDGVNKAMTNYLGNGVGNTFVVNDKGILVPIVIDSGVLDTFFTLGWFGAIPYLGGIILLFLKILQFSEFRSDPFMAASRAIAIACFATLPIFSVMLGNSGMFLWGFLGISFAGHKYYAHQRTRSNY